jgi:cytochrome c oxidase cbb3-type subunit III
MRQRPFGQAPAMRKRLKLSFSLGVLLAAVACNPPGKPVANVESTIENAQDFTTIFRTNCSGCHGPEGKQGAARTLNDPLYLAIIPKEELRKVIENGRPGTSMPAWARSQGGPLTPKQIDVLVDGIRQNWARPVDVPDLPPYSAPVESGDATRGKKIFAMSCFMCHGKGAPVGPINTPSYLSLVSNEYLRSMVLAGRPDLPPGMPSYRNLKVGHPLSPQEISDVVAYLASLRPANAQPTNARVNGNQTGQGGEPTAGNEGSGYGPGSPQQRGREGAKQPNANFGGGTIEHSK